MEYIRSALICNSNTNVVPIYTLEHWYKLFGRRTVLQHAVNRTAFDFVELLMYKSTSVITNLYVQTICVHFHRRIVKLRFNVFVLHKYQSKGAEKIAFHSFIDPGSAF